MSNLNNKKRATYNPLSIEEGNDNDSDRIHLATNSVSGPCTDGSEMSSSSVVSTAESATFMSCYVCLFNTILGGGVLGMPYVLSKTGWILGTILCVICACFSFFGLHELSYCAKKSTMPSSFYSVAMLSAPKYVWLIDAAVAIKCFGVATSYLIIFTDLMPEAAAQLGGSGLWLKRSTWLLISYVTVTPIGFLDSFSYIRFTSTFCLIVVWALTFIIIIYATEPNDGTSEIKLLDPCYNLPSSWAGDDNAPNATEININAPNSTSVEELSCFGDHIYWSTSFVDVIRVLPIIVFSFTCHQNAFPVVNELINPTARRIDLVYLAAMGSALMLFLIFSYASYSTYGDHILPDSLRTYPETVVITITRICISVSILLTYPLQCNPCRRCCLTLIRSLFNDGENYKSQQVERNLSIGVTTSILCGTFIITALTNNLGIVFSLIGATGSTIVSYILPGSFYYILTSPTSSVLMHDDPNAPEPPWRRTLALIQICVGMVMIPLCCSVIIENYVNS